MTALEKAIQVESEACEALWRIEEQRNERERRLLATVKQTLADEYGDAIAAAVAAKRAASAAVRLARYAERAADPRIGRKVAERRSRGEWSRRRVVDTGRRGVVELISAESLHPEHGRAKIGDFVVRILKKDGTPSLRYEEFGSWMVDQELPHGWHFIDEAEKGGGDAEA